MQAINNSIFFHQKTIILELVMAPWRFHRPLIQLQHLIHYWRCHSPSPPPFFFLFSIILLIFWFHLSYSLSMVSIVLQIVRRFFKSFKFKRFWWIHRMIYTMLMVRRIFIDDNDDDDDDDVDESWFFWQPRFVVFSVKHDK